MEKIKQGRRCVMANYPNTYEDYANELHCVLHDINLYNETTAMYESKDYCVKRVNQFCKPFNNNNWCWQFVEFWNRLDKAEKFELLDSLKLEHWFDDELYRYA